MVFEKYINENAKSLDNIEWNQYSNNEGLLISHEW